MLLFHPLRHRTEPLNVAATQVGRNACDKHISIDPRPPSSATITMMPSYGSATAIRTHVMFADRTAFSIQTTFLSVILSVHYGVSGLRWPGEQVSKPASFVAVDYHTRSSPLFVAKCKGDAATGQQDIRIRRRNLGRAETSVTVTAVPFNTPAARPAYPNGTRTSFGTRPAPPSARQRASSWPGSSSGTARPRSPKPTPNWITAGPSKSCRRSDETDQGTWPTSLPSASTTTMAASPSDNVAAIIRSFPSLSKCVMDA